MTQHQTISTAEAGYDAIAKHYDGWKWQKIWAALEEPRIKAMIAADKGQLPLNILDIGVGTGRNLAFIKREFSDAACTGLDISSGMLAVARSNLGASADLSKGNARRLFEQESSAFSHALLCRVTSHIENPWPVLAEATRVVLPYGKIFISDLHPDHNYQNTHCHLADRTVAIETYKHADALWQRMARNLGLKILFAHEVTGAEIAALPGITLPGSIAGPQSRVATLRLLMKD